MKLFRNIILAILVAFAVGVMAQEHPTSPEPAKPAQSEVAPGANSNRSVSEELAHTSREAAGEEENAQFKHSPSVRFVAKHTGLSVAGAYWLLVVVNFAIIAVFVVWALKKNLPAAFRARTETIRKSMDEARRASDDANRRLTDIEGRLSKLDQEIADMKQKAEADAVAEEQRIRATAEEEGHKIITSAEQEIEAAAKSARRDLQAYAAELAVTLAEKRIHVDPKTDEALVGTFVRQLGKDGRQ